MSDSYFSATYTEAKRRFTEAAKRVCGNISSYSIGADSQNDLAIDVAVLGPEDAPAIVVSSGVHGVEGFFGSAIQLALLDQASIQPNLRYVLIHSVNPFGHCHLRRFNEDNVDLNRNFLENTNDYAGAPEGYARLDAFLNPQSPPTRFEPFRMKAIWNIWRNGMQAVKQSVAGGQYEYPMGLFFGGHGPCKSTRLIYQHCDSWIGSSDRIVHIDFHSGLGSFGSYKLLLIEGADSDEYSWYANIFGSDCVEPLSLAEGTAYKVSGLFGEWMKNHFGSREYRFVGAEFGTYGAIRVLGAMRAENRAYHYGAENSSICRAAKAELLECFCPSDTLWRSQVVESGLKIMDQGAKALSDGR